MFHLFKKKQTGEVIAKDCYDKLPSHLQTHFEPTTSHDAPTHKVEQTSNGDFATSFMMGEITGSAMLGGAIGGDMLGGIIGAELSSQNDSSSSDMGSSSDSGSSDFGGFDGGSGGGAGAGGDF